MRAALEHAELEEWQLQDLARHRINSARKTIKLVVSDIEGCLNLDEKTYDHDSLAWIRRVNQLARTDNVLPFVTVASGRQHAFVEAFVRMLDGATPAIFENGCGLFFPARDLYNEYQWHPALNESDVLSEHARVRAVVERVCKRTGARRVIGKEVLITLHPRPSTSVAELRFDVEAALLEAGASAAVTNSASAVDIAPVGIDKAAGLRWLITNLDEYEGFELATCCGIGDSMGDVSLLRIVGLSAAPANAAEEVKELVGYCSPNADGKGVVNIIQNCITINDENT